MGLTQNFLGLFGGLQSQQNLWAQQQQMQQMQNTPTLAWSGNASNTYVVSMAPVEAVPMKPKGPESALEWLDRRVNEVRLPLAA